MRILSPETDNCPSWISGRERMTVENISWSISTKECCRPRRGLNLRPPGLQSDGASNWATEAGDAEYSYDGSYSEIGFNIPKGNYHSPFHLIEEMQTIIDRCYGSMLKKNNASISITYAKNSQRVKVHLQDPNQFKFFFPTPPAESKV